MHDREVGEPDEVVGGFSEHLLNFGQLSSAHTGDGVEPFAYMSGVGLGEDGADRRATISAWALGNVTEDSFAGSAPGRLPLASAFGSSRFRSRASVTATSPGSRPSPVGPSHLGVGGLGQ
jgi:hypothetical protein